MNRRDFLHMFACATASLTSGCGSKARHPSSVDEFIRDQMRQQHIPGIAYATVKSGLLHSSQGLGWADIERQVPMTAHTLMNVASLSKPFVGTAVLQCVDRGDCALDDDINEYLDFPVHNPNFGDDGITFEQLLTHHSSIADGSSYGQAYACGESQVPLQEWITGYLEPGGRFYSAIENFHEWAPGENYAYNNVAFGLLAYAVERISGQSFSVYCEENIFGPLNMSNTSWFVADIDKSQHAIPYAYVADGVIHSPSWGSVELGLLSGDQPAADFDGPYPDCIYDHPNFPDGFLRTSISQLVNFQISAIRGEILDDDQGVVWHRRTLPNGPEVLGHGGGDPGISTSFDFEPVSGNGVIVFANTYGASLDEISSRLFAELEDLFDA